MSVCAPRGPKISDDPGDGRWLAICRLPGSQYCGAGNQGNGERTDRDGDAHPPAAGRPRHWSSFRLRLDSLPRPDPYPFLAVAATQGRAGRGALLMAAYSLGLGIPFLATGLAFGRISGALSWVKRHNTGIGLASSGGG